MGCHRFAKRFLFSAAGKMSKLDNKLSALPLRIKSVSMVLVPCVRTIAFCFFLPQKIHDNFSNVAGHSFSAQRFAPSRSSDSPPFLVTLTRKPLTNIFPSAYLIVRSTFSAGAALMKKCLGTEVRPHRRELSSSAARRVHGFVTNIDRNSRILSDIP